MEPDFHQMAGVAESQTATSSAFLTDSRNFGCGYFISIFFGREVEKFLDIMYFVFYNKIIINL
jgi:hypothetical protein